MSDDGDIQNLWSPSQELSNDVSYVGLSEIFFFSTCLMFWGLRWYNFTWRYRIMVIFTIFDLQVKRFPMMYHMLVYLKLLKSLHVKCFEDWAGIYTYEDVGSWWYSESIISKSRAFQRCTKRWFIWNFYNLYMFKVLRFEMVYIHLRMSDHGDFQNL